FFYFTFGDSDANRPQWFFDTGDKQNRHSFDLAWRSANQQPVQANAELKEDAPGEQKRGSVWFDRDSFRLLPMRGTKLALLDKNEWYTVDRVPLAELRRLLEEAPIESFELPRLKDSNTPASRQELRQIPSLILQNNEGTIAVARVQSGGPPGTLSLQFCYRPQGPYPPFRPADEEYENDGLDTVYIPAAWIKKTPTFPAIPADADVIDAAADRFVASIERQKLSFVTAEHLAALNGEMRRYLKARVKQPPLAASRPEVLEAIDPYVVMLFDRPPGAIGQEQYLNFRNHFETLRWLIWTVLDRPTLTPDQFIERDRQREWMRALVRSLPESPLAAANPEVSKQSQLDRLERNVFNNPLSPFFYDPMSADEFKRLTERYAQNRSLAIEGAAHAIFSAVIDVRLPGLRDRYPSGFPAGNLSVTDFRIFSHGDYIRHIHSQVGMQPKDKSHDYVDLTTGRLVYGQPKILPGQSAPSAEAIEQFWQANKEGDLWFDPAERRLVAVHGAKMVTLPETRWEALDRLSLAELRRSLSGQTVEGVTFSAFANASSPEAVRAFRKWPTLLVETSRGQISLVRAWQTGDGLSLQIRPRPQGSYYPFHGPDEGFEPSERWPLPPLEAVEHLSDRFAEALDRQQLPFVGPREREALRAELREYLELRLRRPLFGPSRKAIVRELERFVERNFEGADGYLRFRARFDALKWRLWTATERRENLTGDEQQALAQQRQWMFHYLEQVAIARLPNGVPPDPAVLTRERGLLDTEYFENPLNPFFRDPMPVEDFETFRKHVLSDAAPKNARKQLFMAAVYTRSAELKRRWPPGFPARRVHVYGAGDFDFGGASDEWNVEWRWNHKPASEHVLLAVADNKLVEPPAELEEKDLQAWIAQNKQGDLSFDAQTGTLLPLRGARLARLDALEWWAIDRVPLAELHQRLADHPLESVTLPEAFASKSQRPTAWERLQGILAEIRLKSQPALVLETAEGKVVVLRVERYDDGMLLVRGRTWPRPPYPPFHAGDLQVAEAAAGRPAPEGGPGP
ncbi:MAG TPA: hypothetical protein VMF30_09285, partial [Pirellulales bacterium]|nr:hypothetical protein [Pirellulales bacterium]